MLNDLWLRVRALFRRKAVEAELDDELRFHLESQVEKYVQSRMAPEEARRHAQMELGGIEQLKEECRDARGIGFFEDMWRDVRYAARMLRKSPGFTIVAILTLALGIGANTAIFSLVDAVMLRALPVENPSQLVLLRWRAHHAPSTDSYMAYDDCRTTVGPGQQNSSGCSFSEPMFREIARSDAFSGIAAFANSGGLDLSRNGPATIVTGRMVSGDFFRTMGVKAAVGRTLVPADDNPLAGSVAVLSYSYWKSAFGGSRAAVGRVVDLNGVPFTIVGVAEPKFTGITPGSDYDIWLPLSDMQRITGPFRRHHSQSDAGFWWLTIVGRLKPGAQRAQTQAVVNGLFRNETLHGSVRLFKAADNPELALLPAQKGLTGSRSQYADPLYVLMLAVGIILLIACANVAGLMVARASARQKEMAVRLALGAGRGRVVRQLLTESVVLSVIGGALGILLAYWGAHAIVSFVASNQTRPLGFPLGVDPGVLGFTVAVSLLCGVLFGLAPALRNAHVDLTPTLKEAAGSPNRPGGAGRRWLTLGNGLVVAQVGLAVVVLAGAGLLLRTLANLRDVNFGFDAHNILTFDVNPSLLGYTGPKLDSFYQNLQDRLAETPGVRSASYSMLPLLSNGLMMTSFHWPGEPQDERSDADILKVGLNFFSTMHIPLLTGRVFHATDFQALATSPGAKPSKVPTPVIVNREFVAKFLGKQSPLGKRFGEHGATADVPANPGYEIIGVVRDAKYNNLRRAIHPMMYVPQRFGGASFALRTAADPRAILPAVRNAVAQLDANLPMSNVTTESERIDRLLFQERLMARLSGFFGVLSLALACIGLYGLLSYEVSRRTREIGIRMALGAQRSGVLRLMVGQGLALALVGVVVGTAVSIGVTRYLGSLLYAVRPTDPATFVAVPLILIAVALAACAVPAWRAMRVDPATALRHE